MNQSPSHHDQYHPTSPAEGDDDISLAREWEKLSQEFAAEEAQSAAEDAKLAAADAESAIVEAQLAAEQVAEAKEAFNFIETTLGYDIDERSTAWVMSGITGVYSDIKPVAFEHIFDELIDDSDASLIQTFLRQLGITTDIVTDEFADENGVKMQTWYFSKRPELITELQAAFDRQHDDPFGPEQDADYREIGRLLGYPATATEYFIQRYHSDDPYSNEPNSRHYIHSPEHAAAEYAAYEEPLYAAMREYCPASLEHLLQDPA